MHQPALPQRDVWLRHIGAPTRTLSHQSPLPPSSHLTFASTRSSSSALSPSFLRRFLVSFVSSPQGRPAAFQIQSDHRHGMCFNYLLSYGPSLRFPLVLALRLLYEGKAFCWLTLEPYNDHYIDRCSQHLALFPFSPCGWSTRLWPTVG